VAVAVRGVRGFLAHAGALVRHDDLNSTTASDDAARTTTLLDMPDGNCYTTSEHDGLLELCKELGDRVESGDVIARIYDAARTGLPPVEYRARRSGLLAARHFPGLVRIGDTVAVVAEVVEQGIAVAENLVASTHLARAQVMKTPATV
jgi:N-alpha-acetyl-L-2,4-diaminobutyrate deacetylase